ncbi:MAG: lysylphosphatidylglycerol synthase domain-containing protein [Puia sp.]|nr:lysylphosphatidylglycerol synthase domain-containing protein [Puia sp.]
MLLNKNIKLIINYVLGPLVFLVLAYSIYRQIGRQRDWLQSLQQIKKAVEGPRRWQIGMAVLLMPLNWGIEARKWQLLIGSVGRISFRNAFKAVLTGTTLASFTPNRMGEYLGRILYIPEGQRLRGISLTIAGSIAQLLVTLTAGVAGIFYLRERLDHPFILFFTVIALWTALTIIYFRLSWLVGLLDKSPAWGRYKKYIKVPQDFRANILIRILFLSFLRYAVFMIQYQLLFSVFGTGLTGAQVWGGMSVVFLVMAIVPTFTFLTELGLRWEASIQIMELFSGNTVGIFAASFGIWLINLIIPALAGSLLILSIKLFRNK